MFTCSLLKKYMYQSNIWYFIYKCIIYFTRTPKLCLIRVCLTKNNKESENWSKEIQEYDYIHS